jgi:haloalkane dehalogenase
MVHGNPDWSFSYRDLIKNLRNEYRCVAVDHIGFGLSDKPTDWDYLPQSHSRNFETFINQQNLKNITLVVNDWGGPIGISYAVRNPENVARLVIMNSAMWSVNDDWYYRLFSTVLGGDIGRYLARRFNLMPRFLLPALLRNPAKRTLRLMENFSAASGTPSERKGQWVFPRQIIDSGKWLDEQFARIHNLQRIPVLLIWGMKDRALIRDEFRRWEKVLPQAELLEIRNASHYPHEDASDEVATAIRRFLEAHPCKTVVVPVQPLVARVSAL